MIMNGCILHLFKWPSSSQLTRINSIWLPNCSSEKILMGELGPIIGSIRNRIVSIGSESGSQYLNIDRLDMIIWIISLQTQGSLVSSIITNYSHE